MRRTIAIQASIPGLCPIEAAVEKLASGGAEERGAIFTRLEVVNFILDLVGYTTDQPLHNKLLIEPSFGRGDFLIAAVTRLFEAWRIQKTSAENVRELATCIRGVELHRGTFDETRVLLDSALVQYDVRKPDREALLSSWLVQGDFLLSDLPQDADYVVGNPPYLRQELIPDALMAEYRRQFSTVYDRADIYVPFIQRSLSLLRESARLGFICADRWMKNRYGGPLRRLVAEEYRLLYYVDMVDTPAFHSDVIAYPAIFIIARDKPGPARLARRPQVDAEGLRTLANALRSSRPSKLVTVVQAGAASDAPWIFESSSQLALVRKLEKEFPTLEDAGCKVGIGVATGADSAFIGPYESLNVEPDRKLPLVMTRDIHGGTVSWGGLGVVNPFDDGGRLVPLSDFPRMAAHFQNNLSDIRKRHVSKKNPSSWYRTIDRIYPELTYRPKLLIPDIKGEANIVFEEGKFYPHHNLYYIASEEWDLRALQVVLKSGIARLFVSLYSTKMRGGYLRYQAQYLRRIRIPRWDTVSANFRTTLVDASETRDIRERDDIVRSLYGLTRSEMATLVEAREAKINEQ